MLIIIIIIDTYNYILGGGKWKIPIFLYHQLKLQLQRLECKATTPQPFMGTGWLTTHFLCG
jgi:hypothetical protein